MIDAQVLNSLLSSEIDPEWVESLKLHSESQTEAKLHSALLPKKRL